MNSRAVHQAEEHEGLVEVRQRRPAAVDPAGTDRAGERDEAHGKHVVGHPLRHPAPVSETDGQQHCRREESDEGHPDKNLLEQPTVPWEDSRHPTRSR